MAFSFPKVTLPGARARVVEAGVTTVTSARLWTEAATDLFGDMRCGDALGVGIGDRHAGLVAGRLLGRRTPHPAAAVANHRLLARVMRMVSVALRARTSLHGAQPFEVCEAIFTPLGAVVHAVGAAARRSSLDVLREAVLRLERERSGDATPIDGAAVWSNLICGRWSLIDDYENGRQRYILAVRNDICADTLALHPMEARTIELSVLGKCPKEMADDLGVSLSRTYALRQSALEKLSARSIGDVIALGRQLPGVLWSSLPLGQEALFALKAPVAAQDLARLTNAERDVVRDLMRSVSRREIARRRKRSLRTVANQVSSIYQKLRVSNRNELIAFLRSSSP
jgi:DNA-binding CsgD family transcriptional regulator